MYVQRQDWCTNKSADNFRSKTFYIRWTNCRSFSCKTLHHLPSLSQKMKKTNGDAHPLIPKIFYTINPFSQNYCIHKSKNKQTKPATQENNNDKTKTHGTVSIPVVQCKLEWCTKKKSHWSWQTACIPHIVYGEIEDKETDGCVELYVQDCSTLSGMMYEMSSQGCLYNPCFSRFWSRKWPGNTDNSVSLHLPSSPECPCQIKPACVCVHMYVSVCVCVCFCVWMCVHEMCAAKLACMLMYCEIIQLLARIHTCRKSLWKLMVFACFSPQKTSHDPAT